MATLIFSGREIGYTILPYTFDTPLKQELITNTSDYVLGYVTKNPETGEFKFIYTESGELTEANDHWSLNILKNLPYFEDVNAWIIYNCPPHKTKSEFGKILNYEALHINNWDIWTVKGKDAKIAVITSWEIF